MPNHSIFKKKLEKIFEIYRKATKVKKAQSFSCILDTLDCLLTKNGVVFKMFLERDVELPFLTA